MKECKYNDFNIKFFSHNETLPNKKYHFCIFHEGIFDRSIVFGKSRFQIIFNLNEHMQQLSNCSKIIIVKKGIEFILLWTSLKGKNELYDLRGGWKEFFDYLILNSERNHKNFLYIGNSHYAPLACWRNGKNCDVIYQSESVVDTFLKETVEQYLPF